MISQTAEYALRAVVFLAAHPTTAFTTRDVAKTTQVPEGYLAKVMQNLSRAGIVNSQRGRHGGFTLGKPPKELSAYDVVQAVDPIRRILECPLKQGTRCAQLCKLHRRLDDAAAQVEASFRKTTIAELVPTTPEPIAI